MRKFDVFQLNIFAMYLLMIITISSFGQTLFGVGLSLIATLIFASLFFLRLLNSHYDKILLLTYILLIFYGLTRSLFENDLNYSIIAVFTISVFFLMRKKLSLKTIILNFFLISVLSLIILVLYNYQIFLVNWNPNTISYITLFGLLTSIFVLNYSSFKMRMIVIPLFILLFVEILKTDSRNSLLAIIVYATLLIFQKKLNERKILLWSIIILSVTISMIIPVLTDQINNSTYFLWFENLSLQFFGKDTIFSNRDDFWYIIRYLLGNDWFFGTGKSLYHIMYSHNMFYSIVFYYGLVGYFLFITFNVLVFKSILRNSNLSNESLSLLFLYLSIFWIQIAENTMFTSDLSMFIPYVILGLSYNSSKLKE